MTTKHTYFIYAAAMTIGIIVSGIHCSAQKKIRVEIAPEYLRQYAEDSVVFFKDVCRDSNLDTIFQVKYGKDSTKFFEWHTSDNKILKFEPSYANFIFGNDVEDNFVSTRYYKAVNGEEHLLCCGKTIVVLLDRRMHVIDSRVMAVPRTMYIKGNRNSPRVQLDSVFVKIGYETEGHWEPAPNISRKQKYHIGLMIHFIY